MVIILLISIITLTINFMLVARDIILQQGSKKSLIQVMFICLSLWAIFICCLYYFLKTGDVI